MVGAFLMLYYICLIIHNLMSKTWKYILTTLIIGMPTIPIGIIIWPQASEIPMPEGITFVLLAGIAVLEALAFGVAVSMLLFDWKTVSMSFSPVRSRLMAIYISAVWSLITWWPHDRMHISNGVEMWGHIFIEYMFHATLIIAAFISAYSLITLVPLLKKNNK